MVIGCAIAVIPLGSPAAFLNIQTIGNTGLLVSYIICIICRLHSRNFGSVYGNLSKPPPFYLGKVAGNIINVIAVLVLIAFLVSSTFPTAPHPSLDLMNWSSLALGCVVTVAALCYIRLRKRYLQDGQEPEAESVELYVGNDKAQSEGVF
jgi:choline transport protein